MGGGGSSRGEVKDAPNGKERTKQKRAFTLLLPSLLDVPPSLASVELMILLMCTY